MKHYFRDILARAAPDSREEERMKAIFTKIAGLKRGAGWNGKIDENLYGCNTR
jgi:hypothetical protein